MLVKKFLTSANIWRSWLIESWVPFDLHFCPQRCRTRKMSKWQKLLLIVVMLTGRLIRVYYQQISNCCRPALTYWLTDWCHEKLTDCWSCTAFCSDIFFFVTAVVFSRSWDFLYRWCEQHFVTELNTAYLPDKYCKTVFLSGYKSYTTVCFNCFLNMAIF